MPENYSKELICIKYNINYKKKSRGKTKTDLICVKFYYTTSFIKCPGKEILYNQYAI